MSRLWSALIHFRRALVPSGGLAERAVKSGIWATLINIVDRVLQLGKIIVLANLLSPEDFGLMGIALLTLAVFQRFSHLGLNSALIQRKEENVDEYLDTAWSMNVVRGLLITVFAYLAAPFVAIFFNDPRATDIIRVIAISPIIFGFKNPGIVYFQKELQFHKQFVYRIGGTVIGVTVALLFAFQYQNVWALVFGLLAGDITRTITSYIIHDYWPQPAFQYHLARELFNYGKWVTASSIVIFLVMQGDDAFVGWYLGVTALGFYQLSYRLSNSPTTEVTHVISNVAFPTYSKLQQNLVQLREGFLNILTLITVISLPLAIGMIAVTPLFVKVFLGEGWFPIILPMQVLAIFGASRSIGAATGPLYQAVGRPDYDTKLALLHVILLAPTIYVSTATLGLLGTAIAIVSIHILITIVDTYLAMTILETDYVSFLHQLIYPLIASMAMGGIVSGMRRLEIFGHDVLFFFFLILVGVISYIALIFIMERYLDYQIRPVISMMRNALT